MTLIEISVHLIRVKPGNIDRRRKTILTISVQTFLSPEANFASVNVAGADKRKNISRLK